MNFIVKINAKYDTKQLRDELRQHATSVMADPFLSDTIFVCATSTSMPYYHQLESDGKLTIENEKYAYQV